MLKVFWRQHSFIQTHGPLDVKFGTLDGNPTFAFRRIIVVAFVFKHGHVAEHGKPMGKSARDKQLKMILFRKLDSHMSAICR